RRDRLASDPDDEALERLLLELAEPAVPPPGDQDVAPEPLLDPAHSATSASSSTRNSAPVLARTSSTETPGARRLSFRPSDSTSNTARSLMMRSTTPLP